MVSPAVHPHRRRHRHDRADRIVGAPRGTYSASTLDRRRVCSESATMSVNVSPRQLSDPNFPSIVNEALNRSGVSPQLLWLEVTESVMIAEPELALATLRRVRSLGVRIALDDFGTGYSSLSLLQKFPLQRIKIDRAFVHGVADNPTTALWSARSWRWVAHSASTWWPRCRKRPPVAGPQ